MQIGEAIKKIRREKNLKQKDLSVKCNITQTYLSQIENNRRKPNLSLIERLSDCLDVPLPVILFLALTENDVSLEKRSLFQVMSPSIQKYINDIFISS